MTSGTEKLDKMLSCGKSHGDKKGLGYMEDMETTSLKKTTFVKNKEIEDVQIPQQSTTQIKTNIKNDQHMIITTCKPKITIRT